MDVVMDDIMIIRYRPRSLCEHFWSCNKFPINSGLIATSYLILQVDFQLLTYRLQ